MTLQRKRSFDLDAWMDGPARVAFAKAGTPRRHAAGQLIYQQGDSGAEMYRIMTGTVRLSVSRDDGREIVFLRFGQGDCFGVSSLIDGLARPQTAEALTDVVLHVLDRPAFDRLRAAHRSFDDALLRLLALQMRVVSSQFIEASLMDLTSRVAGRLLEYAQPMAGKITVQMSQADLAALVGASRQSVNRVLQQLQAQQIVSLDFNALHVADAAALREVSRQGADW